jgi:hypothetical protein
MTTAGRTLLLSLAAAAALIGLAELRPARSQTAGEPAELTGKQHLTVRLAQAEAALADEKDLVKALRARLAERDAKIKELEEKKPAPPIQADGKPLDPPLPLEAAP